MQYALVGEVTKAFLFDRIPQEQLMEFYLGVPVKIGNKFTSPLRNDRNPTCNYFYAKDGDLLMKDHSGAFVGNVVQVVRYMYDLNYPQALERIAQDFGLISGGHSNIQSIQQDRLNCAREEKQKAFIQVKLRKWEPVDLEYWAQFGISPATLEYYNVFVIDTAWINDFIVYTYRPTDPCYAYRFGVNEYKLYFPLREKGDIRFMGNSQSIQGYKQLPDSGKLLVLTKSMKDVMALHELGIVSAAFQAESILPSEEAINEFINRFELIYTLYDFDLAGIRTANKIKRRYNIQPIFLTNGRFNSTNQKAKDVAEFIALHKIQKVRQFVDSLKTQHNLW